MDAPPAWHRIHATHVDHDGRRYEVLSLENNVVRAFTKEPSAEMRRLGCNACSGPHRPRNKRCRVRPLRAVLRRPPHGFVLFDLFTHVPVPGVWHVTRTKRRDNRRSGYIEARRAPIFRP